MKAIKKFLTVLMFVTCSVFSQEQVDVYEKYGYESLIYQEENDCSVMAFAEAFRISYLEAKIELSRFRKSKQGIKAYEFLSVVRRRNHGIELMLGNGIDTTRDVLGNIPFGDYLVIVSGHAFFIENYMTYRIHDDYKRLNDKIIMLIKIR